MLIGQVFYQVAITCLNLVHTYGSAPFWEGHKETSHRVFGKLRCPPVPFPRRVVSICVRL